MGRGIRFDWQSQKERGMLLVWDHSSFLDIARSLDSLSHRQQACFGRFIQQRRDGHELGMVIYTFNSLVGMRMEFLGALFVIGVMATEM
jgi:hypothetical protein